MDCMYCLERVVFLYLCGPMFKSDSGTSLNPVVKNLPSNAGDTGSIPGPGTKIPHAKGQLSLRTTTTEPIRLN